MSFLSYKGKSVRNRGVSQEVIFPMIPRSLLRGGFIESPMVIDRRLLGYAMTPERLFQKPQCSRLIAVLHE
jgi:hypothetical protein